MRLIDIKKLRGCAIIRPHTGIEVKVIEQFSDKIAHQDVPTAYDVDGIIRRLDDASFLVATSKEFWDDPQNGKYVENVVRLSDAIEIVKRGGKSDK